MSVRWIDHAATGRWRRAVEASLVAVVATASLCAGAADRGDAELLRDRLCPAQPERRRVVNLNGVETRAPATVEEESAALARLSSATGEERWPELVSLAMGGSMRAFRELLAAGDVDDLRVYARSYFNQDGRACVADEIEQAVLAHLEDEELRPALLAFFGKNRYQSRELFDRLVLIELGDGKPDHFQHVVMALTATRLDGVADEVLAQAERYLDHDTPLLKRVLPGVHRRYVSYFADVLYGPAVPYLERLLQAEGYEATIDSFKAEFSVTRSQVYRALDRYPSSMVADIYIRQLARVVDQRPPGLVLYEMAAFGRYAVRHATTDEQSRQVSELLAELLGHQRPAGGVAPTAVELDYRLRTKVVELLTDLGTDHAAVVLVDELGALALLEGSSTAQALVVRTLDALRRLPEGVQLDVEGFLEVAVQLSERDRLHSVPAVLDAHPDPAAHRFYLDQMAWIVANRRDFKLRYHVEHATVLAGVVERLLRFEEPEELKTTRNELDRLYLAELLDEGLYVATSVRLNDLLGDQSPAFEALMDRRTAARIAEERRQQEEARSQWMRIVDEKTSPEGIGENLRLLGGSGWESGEAAAWLVIAGPDILPQAHGALAASAASDELVFRLLAVLGEVGDLRSVTPVVETTRRRADNRTLLRAGFRALTLLPAADAAFELAGQQLADDRPAFAHQGALVYLAAVRERRAGPLAREYSGVEIEPEVRVAGLLLAARLGERDVKSAIIELMETTEDRSLGEVLMRALAELSTPESLRSVASRFPAHRERPYFAQVERLVEFRHAEGGRKIELAKNLAETGHRWDRREAVGFLVENGHTTAVLELLGRGPPVGLPFEITLAQWPNGLAIVAQLRRMGYRVEETLDGLELIPAE